MGEGRDWIESMNGKTKPQSLERRIEAFFEANRGEELSVDDMMVKFGCSMAAAERAVSRLRQSGMPIVSVMVYRLKTTEEGA